MAKMPQVRDNSLACDLGQLNEDGENVLDDRLQDWQFWTEREVVNLYTVQVGPIDAKNWSHLPGPPVQPSVWTAVDVFGVDEERVRG